MPTPGLAEFHRRLALLPLGLPTARHGQAGLRHQLGQLGLILRRVEPAIERRAADLPAEPLLHRLQLPHHNFPVLGAARQHRVVAHEARAVLDDQDAVAELDRLRHLAAFDQLGLRLEQAEELLAVGDRLLGEDASVPLIAGPDRQVHEVEQPGPEPFYRLRRRADTDRDQGGVEQLAGPGDDPVGLVEEDLVGGPEPFPEVRTLARGDPVDGAKVLLDDAAEVVVLTPAGPAQQGGQAARGADDDAQAVADEAGIGGIVDLGGHDERVAADGVGGLGDQAMAFGDDAVVEPLDGLGREQGDVVAEAPPVEGGGLVPAADAHDEPQGLVLLGEVLEPIVVEVAAQAYGGEDEDGPVVQAGPAAIGAGGGVDILCDGFEELVAEFGLGVDVLQGAEDGDDLITTVVVESDLGDGRGVEAKLGIEGDAHGRWTRRFSRREPKIRDSPGRDTRPGGDLREESLAKTVEKAGPTAYSDGDSLNKWQTWWDA